MGPNPWYMQRIVRIRAPIRPKPVYTAYIVNDAKKKLGTTRATEEI